MNVPEINFREANAQDVVTFLQEESAKLSPDKKAINFVWLVPGGTKVPTVSLSLKHIPMLDVLQYITQITGLRYRVHVRGRQLAILTMFAFAILIVARICPHSFDQGVEP